MDEDEEQQAREFLIRALAFNNAGMVVDQRRMHDEVIKLVKPGMMQENGWTEEQFNRQIILRDYMVGASLTEGVLAVEIIFTESMN